MYNRAGVPAFGMLPLYFQSTQAPYPAVILLVAGALSSQLADLESSLNGAIESLQGLIDKASSTEDSSMLTMWAVRLQQPEVRCPQHAY